jgi:hypothetical protein
LLPPLWGEQGSLMFAVGPAGQSNPKEISYRCV